ncbi:hypothetical protein A3194_00160 [Candidatus Thiodiazotropha endoloripes]|uniref:hypothetical protein n=1 Tax=Candidatus Thiodiazotropha endoloripes TaxID=1818881 RepID=UPI00083D5468|nr:hypothetical protein [Candidatus Thiodiazotropha endoloripes]MCG7915223.1 hypothetical protein [Candidatus Thiodiazotropha weberae]ODB93159.1 hypothetical protein A3194_00160 [Candidatus Thiodiazotropha endoloripes]
MTIANDDETFLSWENACRFVGDEKILREIEELYLHFAGFASVEVEERSYERVYVDGHLRLYPTDVNELKRGLPVTCSSALIDHHMSINGVVREELFQKFLVFDDELLIGLSVNKGSSAYNYPSDISFYHEDLHQICDRFGIKPGVPVDPSPDTQSLTPPSESQPLIPSSDSLPLETSENSLDELNLIGALACMLAMNSDLEESLRDGQHISEIIIDDLFTMLDGLGVDVDGKKKFLYERLISMGVKSILEE